MSLTPVLDTSAFKDLQYVEADLHYLILMAERPINYTYELPSGIPQHNGTYETKQAPDPRC